MANSVYNNFKTLLMTGGLNLESDPIYVMLVSGTYDGSTNAAKRTHITTGDIGNNEVNDPAGGYPRGGSQLTNPTVTKDDVDDEAEFSADNISWNPSSITASGAVVYLSGVSGNPAYLMAFIDFEGNQTSTNGTFQINWHSEGIINIDEGTS